MTRVDQKNLLSFPFSLDNEGKKTLIVATPKHFTLLGIFIIKITSEILRGILFVGFSGRIKVNIVPLGEQQIQQQLLSFQGQRLDSRFVAVACVGGKISTGCLARFLFSWLSTP